MVSSNVHAVQERVRLACQRSGRTPSDVALVAVSKTVPAERMQEAYDAGIRCFGESKVQEAQSKIPRIRVSAQDVPPVEWHLIGSLQRNKAKLAVSLFDVIHSVDRYTLAEGLNAQAAAYEKIQRVLIQVNLSREETKHGVGFDEAERLAVRLAGLSSLQVDGLMTIAPFGADISSLRRSFGDLRRMRDAFSARQVPTRGGWRELSMGMTDDFEVAIEEGATLIRIGRGLFGERPPSP